MQSTENTNPQSPQNSQPPLSVVAITPKVEKGKYLYLLLALILAPGIIAIAVYGYKTIKKSSEGQVVKPGSDTGQNLVSSGRLLEENFVSGKIDDEKWIVGSVGNRNSVSIDDSRLKMEIGNPPEGLEGATPEGAVFISRTTLSGDFDALVDLDTYDLYGSTDFVFALQENTEVDVNNWVGLAVKSDYEGVIVRAMRVIEGEVTFLGARIFEDERKFKLKMSRRGNKTEFLVNDEYLTQTQKNFGGGVAFLSLTLWSHRPGFTKAGVFVDNLVVNSLNNQ